MEEAQIQKTQNNQRDYWGIFEDTNKEKLTEVVDVVDDDEVVSLLLAVLVALFPEMET